MHTCVRGVISLYQLCLGIALCVILVSVVGLASFLRPAGIGVLVAFFVWGIFPQFLSVSFLNLFVLLTAVTLFGSFDKGRIYNLAFVEA